MACLGAFVLDNDTFVSESLPTGYGKSVICHATSSVCPWLVELYQYNNHAALLQHEKSILKDTCDEGGGQPQKAKNYHHFIEDCFIY